MHFFVLVLIIALCLQSTELADAEKVIFCNYGSWAVYRPSGGKVDVTDIDPTLCTHIIYAFVGLSAAGDIRSLDAYRDIDLKGFKNLKKLKNKNPKLKIMVSVGGWNEASTNFSPIAAIPVLRKTVAANILSFLNKYAFDGIDINWEYSADRGGVPSDKKNVNFIEMLKEIRSKLSSKLLTISVGAGHSRRQSSYDVASMNKYVDFFNLMAYDLHGSWASQTGHNAPLSAAAYELDKTLNIEYIVSDWIDAGASPSKLVLGLALYGRSFTLADPTKNALQAPSTGGGEKGAYTGEAGYLSYTEICVNLKKGWKYVFDEDIHAPYAYSGNQWVGFDDVKSLGLKVNLAKQKYLRGVMVWSVEQDDVYNECGAGNFPLLKEINKIMFGSGGILGLVDDRLSGIAGNLKTTTTIATTRATTPRSSFKCTKSGLCADPDDCQKYYFCDIYLNPISFTCPPGFIFDKKLIICNFPWIAKC